MLISWLVFEVYFNRAAMLLFSAALAVVGGFTIFLAHRIQSLHLSGAAVTRIFTPHVMPAEVRALRCNTVCQYSFFFRKI